MPIKIDYYLTPLSPWAYLGHARFAALVERYRIEVTVKPSNFGPIFAASGGLPLAQRPKQRQAYRLTELARTREYLALPLNIHPKHFPVPADAASRMVLAAREELGADAALRICGAIGRAAWADELDISDLPTLVQIATRCSLDGNALAAASQTPEIDALYQSCTADALAAQVFGAPTYILDGELFWGQDRLDFLERALAASVKVVSLDA